MKPEEMPPLPSPAPPQSGIRPPAFLLPSAEKGTAQRTGPELYVTWEGQVYGPSAVDDVMVGLRTGYFGEDAFFWFEGCGEWRPLSELSRHVELPRHEEGPAQLRLPPRIPLHNPPAEGIRPKWPGARRRSSPASPRGERRRRGRGSRSAQQAHRRGGAGRLIVIGAVLLAVLITAGLLLLISAV